MTYEASGQRTVIVTGAARGIGAAVARRLARDGLAVGVIDLSDAGCAGTIAAITGDGEPTMAVAADVCRIRSARHAGSAALAVTANQFGSAGI